jgi:serine/threonine protein kinase
MRAVSARRAGSVIKDGQRAESSIAPCAPSEPSVTDVGEPALVRATSIEIIRGSVLAGRYQIEAVIGKGGSGIVLRAFDRVAQVAVAIKILKPDLAADPRWIERFSRELRLARQIQHPNVCRVFDIGQADGHWFITMELATAGTLRDQLADKTSARTLEEKLRDVTAVVSGLAAIHGAGIVHRDVKPDNFLRMDDGRVVLSDFGLATNPGEAPAVSILVGTPFYMAPEVVMGDVATPRSDVWAAAVVIHEILLGARPERSAATRAPLVKTPGDAPRVTKALLDVCKQSLRDEPADRPADGAALAEQVDAAVTSRRSSLKSKSRTRRRAIWAATIAATLSLAALVGKHLWQPAAAMSDFRSSQPKTLKISGEPSNWGLESKLLATFNGPIHCATLLPDRRHARIIWGSPRRAEDLDIATGVRVPDPLPSVTYAVDCPQLSPSGDQLLFTSLPIGGSPQIVRAAANGSDPVAVTTGSDPLWLPNGEEFVFEADPSHAGVFSLPTMRHTLVPESNDWEQKHLYKKAVSEAGDIVAVVYIDANLQRTLEMYSLPGLERVASFRVPMSVRGVRFVNDALLLKNADDVGSVLRLDWRTGDARRVGYLPGGVVDTVMHVSNDADVLLSQQQSSDVWIYDRDATPRQLTHDGQSYSAARAPNGDVLVSRKSSGSEFALFLYDRTGTSKQVTSGPSDASPSFSADGHAWVYSDYKRKAIVRCTSAGCVDVLRDGLLAAWPRESPDGALVAFVSQEGTPHLGVVDRDGQNKRDLGPTSVECPPVWTSADALWVFAGVGGHRQWSELDVSTGRKTGRSKPATGFSSDEQSCGVDSEAVDSPFYQSVRVRLNETWEARTSRPLIGSSNVSSQDN